MADTDPNEIPAEDRDIGTPTSDEPWRTSIHQEQRGKGVAFHETADSNIGLLVSAENNEKIDAVWREPNGWYEGAEKWAVVAINFPDRFDQDDVDTAHATAREAFPDSYRDFTAKMLDAPDKALGYEKIDNYQGQGIALFETPTDKFLHVAPELNEKIDASWRQPDGLYDADPTSSSDARASVVALSFPDRFDPIELAAAHQDARDHFPDYYEKLITDGAAAAQTKPAFEDEPAAPAAATVERTIPKPQPPIDELISAFDNNDDAKADGGIVSLNHVDNEPNATVETTLTSAPQIKPQNQEINFDAQREKQLSAEQTLSPANSEPQRVGIEDEAVGTSTTAAPPRQTPAPPHDDKSNQQAVVGSVTALGVLASAVAGAFRRDNPPAAAASPPAQDVVQPRAANADAPSQPDPETAKQNSRAATTGAPASDSAAEPSNDPARNAFNLQNILNGFRPQRSEAIVTPSAPQDPTSPAEPGSARALLERFTRERMQPRRDAETLTTTERAASATVSAFERLERADPAAIFSRLRDAAEASPGGMKGVLAEMKPGGAYEDLRKEFNVALDRDKNFSEAYEKATSALEGYATQREVAAPALQSANSIILARLEALDAQIVTASSQTPGKEAGKSALDEAFEKGREAVKNLVESVRNVFTRESPSASPSFSP